jgi:hypothetical protein
MSIPQAPILVRKIVDSNSSTDYVPTLTSQVTNRWYRATPEYDDNPTVRSHAMGNLPHLPPNSDLVEYSYFFVIHEFTTADSTLITEGLNKNLPMDRLPTLGHHFWLTDNGNIKCNGATQEFTWLNPLVPGNTLNFTGYSIKGLRAGLGTAKYHYIFDNCNVISANLKYILKREDATATSKWKLLYNPMHTPEFKTYYENWISSLQTNLGDALFDRTSNYESEQQRSLDPAISAKDPTGIIAYLPFESLFHKYCNALKADNGEDLSADGTRITYGFLDPTCALFYQRNHCNASAFFNINRSSFDLITDFVDSQAAESQIETALSNASSNAHASDCLCYPTLNNMALSNTQSVSLGNPNDSFIGNFQGVQNPGCGNTSVTVNVCTHNIVANTVWAENSNFLNACGSAASGSLSGSDPGVVSPDTTPSDTTPARIRTPDRPSDTPPDTPSDTPPDTTIAYDIPPSTFSTQSYNRTRLRKIVVVIVGSILGFVVLKILVDIFKDIFGINSQNEKINRILQFTTDKGLQSTDKGMQSTDKGMQSTDKGLQSTDKGMQSTDKGMQSTDKGLQSTDKGL